MSKDLLRRALIGITFHLEATEDVEDTLNKHPHVRD